MEFIQNILPVLHYNLMNGNIKEVQDIYIKCKKRNISFSYIDNYMVSSFLNGFTILHYALSSKNIQLVEFLLKNTNIQINKQNRHSSTIMHELGYSYEGNMSIIKYILQKENININIYNKFGDLPIDIASFYGMKEYVQLLICHNSIFNIEKCIYQASFCNHTNIIEWFQKRKHWKRIQFQCEYGFCIWSPENHIYWSLEYKKMVFTILCIIYKKYTHFEKGILYNIFEYISWF